MEGNDSKIRVVRRERGGSEDVERVGGGGEGGGVRRLELYFALDKDMSGKWSDNKISSRLCVFHLTDHRLCHPD